MFRAARVMAPIAIALVGLVVAVVGSSFPGQTLVEAADRQQWEYLTVSYSQLAMLEEELVNSNDPAYDQALFGELICPDPFGFDDSCKDLFRGQAYYLNLWGNDGWELVSVIDKSTEMIYSAEMIFKRPR